MNLTDLVHAVHAEVLARFRRSQQAQMDLQNGRPSILGTQDWMVAMLERIDGVLEAPGPARTAYDLLLTLPDVLETRAHALLPRQLDARLYAILDALPEPMGIQFEQNREYSIPADAVWSMVTVASRIPHTPIVLTDASRAVVEAYIVPPYGLPEPVATRRGRTAAFTVISGGLDSSPETGLPPTKQGAGIRAARLELTTQASDRLRPV